MSNFSLNNQSVLITGSSSGIGLAIAQSARQAGARVIQHGIEEQPKESVPEATYLQQKLNGLEGPESLLQSALEIDPNLSLLVCNAGVCHNAPFLEMTEERWDLTIDINLKANYFLIQQFARHLHEKGLPGAVVITASINGFQAEFTSSAYDVSKGGLVMMIRSLAMELADFDIRVNGIAPGLIYTDATRPGFAKNPGKVQHFERKILRRRIGEPEDCSGAAVFLLSPAAHYITGEIIVIDGGLTVSQIGDLPPA